MSAVIDGLLKQYEGGQISRRDLIVSLSAMALTSRTATAQSNNPPLPVQNLNHVTLNVTDVARSEVFYHRLFGMPTVFRQSNGAVPIMQLGTGPQFVALGGNANTTPRISHFCMTVSNFDPDRTMAILNEQGVEGGRVRMRDGEVPELYFTDPDGISVQLQDVSYCGGSGRLGENCS